MRRYGVQFLLCILACCGTGCADKTLTSVMAHGEPFTIERVIVLPFVNNSHEQHLGFLATRIGENVCNNLGYQLANVADLRLYLQRKHLFMSQLTEQSTDNVFKEISEELQVNSMIKGKILEVNYIKTQGESLPQITLQLELLNASNGTALVRSFIDSRGEDYRTVLRFGVVRTTTQLLELMIHNTIENWQHKGVIL